MPARYRVGDRSLTIDLELGPVDALGRELDVEPLGDRPERDRGRIVGLRHDDRLTRVATRAQLGHERHLTEQRHLEVVGQLLAAALTEQLVALTVVAVEPRHVLDHADDAEVHLARHVRGPLRDLLRGGCGVVTTTTSARGRNCAIDSAMSPVPGGMSTTRKSGSPQCTSVRNCSSALCSIGPRQTTGWSSRAKKPIEISVTPLASGGTMTSSITVGGRSMPSMRGIEKPHTSASTAATLWPRCASATARLVVTDDLPTPPLPDAIARTRVRESVNGLAVRASVDLDAAAELLRERLPLLVGHDREIDVDARDPGQRRRRRR